jgi:hypothetical protein
VLQERLQAAQQRRDQLESRHKTLQQQVRAASAEESRARLRVELRKVRLKLQQAKVEVARLEHEQAAFINEIVPGVFPSSTMRRLKLVEEVEALKLAYQQLMDGKGRVPPRVRDSGSPGASERDDSRHQKRRTQLRLQIAEKVVKIIETEHHEMLRLPPNARSSEEFSKIKRRWKQAVDRAERLRGGSAVLGVCRSADGVGDCCGPVSRRRRSSGDARTP